MATEKKQADKTTGGNGARIPWINIVGGVDTVLMTSGILQQLSERDPGIRFNVVRRSRYKRLLTGHRAIAKIGFPEAGEEIITVGRREPAGVDEGVGSVRPYQALARQLGARTTLEETMYVSGPSADIGFLDPFIPWKKQPVVIISLHADTPRKMIHPVAWQRTVEQLAAKGYFVIQIGGFHEPYIRGAYSLLGILSLSQQMAMLDRADVLVTTDSPMTTAGRLAGIPVVVLWGPSKPENNGYDDQINLKGLTDHCPERDSCLLGEQSEKYFTPCSLKENHCMNTISTDFIVFSVCNVGQRYKKRGIERV